MFFEFFIINNFIFYDIVLYLMVFCYPTLNVFVEFVNFLSVNLFGVFNFFCVFFLEVCKAQFNNLKEETAINWMEFKKEAALRIKQFKEKTDEDIKKSKHEVKEEARAAFLKRYHYFFIDLDKETINHLFEISYVWKSSNKEQKIRLNFIMSAITDKGIHPWEPKWYRFFTKLLQLSLFSNFSEGLSPETVWFFPYTGSVRFDGIVFLHNYITAIEWGLLLLILWISCLLLLIYFYMHSLGFLPQWSLFKYKNSFFSCTLAWLNKKKENGLLNKIIFDKFYVLSQRIKKYNGSIFWDSSIFFSNLELKLSKGGRIFTNNFGNNSKSRKWFGIYKVLKKNFYNNNLLVSVSLFRLFLQKIRKNISLLSLNEKIVKINGLKWYVFGRLIFINSRIVHGQKLEIIWTIIPTIILVFIAYPSFFLLYTIEEILPTSIWSRALGRQWYWVYEYSWLTKMGGKTIIEESYLILENQLKTGLFRLLEVDNALVLPVGMFMRFIVSASDVIHCFTIPSLGLKADGVPGRLNSTSSFIKRPGIYYGQCSELCGVGHGFMPIKAICLLFKYWVELFDCTLRTNLTNFSSFTFVSNDENDSFLL